MGERGRSGEVVDGYEFNVGVAKGAAEHVTSDTAEAVDTYLYSHDLRFAPVEY